MANDAKTNPSHLDCGGSGRKVGRGKDAACRQPSSGARQRSRCPSRSSAYPKRRWTTKILLALLAGWAFFCRGWHHAIAGFLVYRIREKTPPGRHQQQISMASFPARAGSCFAVWAGAGEMRKGSRGNGFFFFSRGFERWARPLFFAWVRRSSRGRGLLDAGVEIGGCKIHQYKLYHCGYVADGRALGRTRESGKLGLLFRGKEGPTTKCAQRSILLGRSGLESGSHAASAPCGATKPGALRG